VTCDSCDPCLRRALLVAHLAPRIAGLLGRGDRRTHGLLGLSEHELIAAAAGRHVEGALAFLDALDVAGERGRLTEAGFLVACAHSPRYPPLLHDLPDAPAVLFGAGCRKALELLIEEPVVTVVGTRRASPYGTEVAYALGRGLGASGVPVVSGLAPPTAAVSTAAACRWRSWPAGPTWCIRDDIGRSMSASVRRASSSRSFRRERSRTGGASRRGTGSWPDWPE